MATTNTSTERVSRDRVAVVILLGLVALAVVVGLAAYWIRAPQMGTDEDVFNTVDALYTAVRNQDEKRLSECEQRLKSYRATGKLPPDAAETLDGIIAKARSGSWETAAERLYDFMKAQKREGPRPTHKHPRKTK